MVLLPSKESIKEKKGAYFKTYIIELKLTDDEVKLLDGEKENICLSMKGRDKIIIKHDCYIGKLNKIEEVNE